MVFTPSPMLLKLLYTRGSLHNLPENAGVAFSLKNRLDTVKVIGFTKVQIGDVVVPAERISELIRYLEEFFAGKREPVAIFGHLGNGNANIRPLLDVNDKADCRTRVQG